MFISVQPQTGHRRLLKASYIRHVYKVNDLPESNTVLEFDDGGYLIVEDSINTIEAKLQEACKP